MEKPEARANRLMMRSVITAYTNASLVAHSFSQSLLILRSWQVQAKARSTAQRVGEPETLAVEVASVNPPDGRRWTIEESCAEDVPLAATCYA